MSPNAPRMITVVIAVVLMVVGLALIFYQGPTIDLVRGIPLPGDITRQVVSFMGEQVVAWAALAAAPILLILGSLLPNL
ncbi:MAG: hypothetical protein ABI797_03685 [Chloroflexota bacterium]